MNMLLSRRLSVILFLFVGILAVIFPTGSSNAQNPFSAGSQKIEAFTEGELLVRFKDGISAQGAMSTLLHYGARLERQLYGSDVKLVKVAKGLELDVTSRLNADENVIYAEPNYRYQIFRTPNDTYYNYQWAHSNINSENAWNLQTGSNTIEIAIIDTGIDENHPDLNSKIIAGYDFIGNDANPHDLNGHGTHVAGIAAAVTNNNNGIAGVSWNAKIMPIRVLNNEGSGDTAGVVSGINWACQHGAHILNMSLGGYNYSQSMQNAINACRNAGKVIIAAMGNDNTSTPAYPAANTNVLAVSATNSSNNRAYYSNYGSHCGVAAPGGAMYYYGDSGGILSTMPTYDVYLTTYYSYTRNYSYLQGTSQAAPHVAGLAALIWSMNIELTANEVQSIIKTTADDLGASGRDNYYGYGIINAYQALQKAKSVSKLSMLPAIYDLLLNTD
jgi:thermitase